MSSRSRRRRRSRNASVERGAGGVERLTRPLHAPRSTLHALCVLALTVACDREVRRFRESPPSAQPAGIVRNSTLQPGPTLDSTHFGNVYQENAYAVTE